MPEWRQFRRGKPEIQAGVLLLAVGVLGLLGVWLWGTGFVPSDPYTVFTSHGFATAVVSILLAGVVTLGAALLVIGILAWAIQRATGRD